MAYMKCSAAAMALCPDRIICCCQEYPGEFAVGSECHRFNEEVMSSDTAKTISAQLAEKIVSQMCDEYCRFPRECECEDELHDEHCDSCPLMELL